MQKKEETWTIVTSSEMKDGMVKSDIDVDSFQVFKCLIFFLFLVSSITNHHHLSIMMMMMHYEEY